MYWTTEEQVLIAKAFVTTKLDLMKKPDQREDFYKSRMSEEYDKLRVSAINDILNHKDRGLSFDEIEKAVFPQRTEDSVYHQWKDAITVHMIKWMGIKFQIEIPDGYTSEMYHELILAELLRQHKLHDSAARMPYKNIYHVLNKLPKFQMVDKDSSMLEELGGWDMIIGFQSIASPKQKTSPLKLGEDESSEPIDNKRAKVRNENSPNNKKQDREDKKIHDNHTDELKEMYNLISSHMKKIIARRNELVKIAREQQSFQELQVALYSGSDEAKYNAKRSLELMMKRRTIEEEKKMLEIELETLELKRKLSSAHKDNATAENGFSSEATGQTVTASIENRFGNGTSKTTVEVMEFRRSR